MEIVVDGYTFLFYSSLITIAVSGLLIVLGILFVKFGYKDYHKRSMLTAFILALIFVVLYLVKSSLYPPQKYSGNYRGIYLFILWSHTLFATVNFPMAIVTIYLALKERFDRHKKIAPYTAAVWIYVALTGWIIRAFLL